MISQSRSGIANKSKTLSCIFYGGGNARRIRNMDIFSKLYLAPMAAVTDAAQFISPSVLYLVRSRITIDTLKTPKFIAFHNIACHLTEEDVNMPEALSS